MPGERSNFDESTVAELARVARLALPAERQPAVASILAWVYRSVDALDDIDLGDVPPATAFDARWE